MMDQKTCHALLGSLSDYVDGAAEDELCAEIERHLASCEDCRIVVDTLRKTITLYKASAGQIQVPEEVRLHLFERLNLEGFAQSEAPID
jgi:predicted anti-sigma-YlaC factor YlaD